MGGGRDVAPAGLVEGHPDRVLDAAGGDLVEADEAGEDRQARGVGGGEAGGAERAGRVQVEERGRVGLPVAAGLREGAVELVEAAAACCDDEHVAVAVGVGAALDPRVGRDRRRAEVGLVGEAVGADRDLDVRLVCGTTSNGIPNSPLPPKSGCSSVPPSRLIWRTICFERLWTGALVTSWFQAVWSAADFAFAGPVKSGKTEQPPTSGAAPAPARGEQRRRRRRGRRARSALTPGKATCARAGCTAGPCRTSPVALEARAVARAVPGPLLRVPGDDAADVGAARREPVKLAVVVAVDRVLLEPGGDDLALARVRVGRRVAPKPVGEEAEGVGAALLHQLGKRRAQVEPRRVEVPAVGALAAGDLVGQARPPRRCPRRGPTC